MAFPTTITTDGLATVGCGGPYISSGGNVYVIITSDNRFNIRALKATDPSSSFAGVGTDVVVGASSDIIRSIAGYQVGDDIHVLTKNSNGSSVVDIRYHVFSMSSDSWTTSNEVVKSNMEHAPGGAGWSCQIGLTVRDDGAVIACYNGATENVSTVEYDRVYYARRISGTWSADIALGTAGVAASFIGGQAISGANNRVHFFFQDRTNQDIYQRTITSAYAMQSLPSSFDTQIEADESIDQRGAYVTASDIVSYPWYDSFQTLNRATFASGDTPTLSVGADITNPTTVLTAPIKFVASHAVDDSTLYNVFLNAANDIYTQSNTGAGWSAPNLFLDTGASAVYASVYVRGTTKVLGIVYHETDPKYHELTLSTSAVASLGLPNGMLLGRCGR